MTVEDMSKWRKILRDCKEEDTKELASIDDYREKLDTKVIAIKKRGSVYDEGRSRSMDISMWKDLATRLTVCLHNSMWALNIIQLGDDFDDEKKQAAVDVIGEAMLTLEEANLVVPLEDDDEDNDEA